MDVDVSDDWYDLKYRTANWYNCSEQLQIAHTVALQNGVRSGISSNIAR